MFYLLLATVFALPGQVEKTANGYRFLPLWLVIGRELFKKSEVVA